MPNQDWLLNQWTMLFGEAIASMAGKAVNVNTIELPGDAEPIVWWSQKLSLSPQEAVWIGAPQDSWNAVGKIALIGAGIDDPTEEDIDGTFRELVQQALSRLAQVIGQQFSKEVTCTEGRLGAAAPATPILAMSIECGEQSISPYLLAFDATLVEALESLDLKANAAAVGADTPLVRLSQEPQNETKNSIELLLDVELPVGVSFGKAILPLRDVIKLTTGSIVELNRSITEPVEIIVNNCVIAKGEVVVIDGNYGVRIHHIVSRQERLRSIK